MWLLQRIINGNYPFAETYLEGDDLYITVGKSRFMTNEYGVHPLNKPARLSKFIKKILEARESAGWTILGMQSWRDLEDDVDYE